VSLHAFCSRGPVVRTPIVTTPVRLNLAQSSHLSLEIKMHEVEIFGFYADLPPQVMQFMELEPDGRSMRYRAQFSWGHAGML
jgi:hypothetical protein